MPEDIIEVERHTEYQPTPGWQPVNATGVEWEVTIIGARTPEEVIQLSGEGYIPSKNGRLYAERALRDSVPMWEGVKVYDNHLTDEEFASRQGMRSVASEWLGSIINPRYDETSHRLVGTLKVVDGALASKLLAAHSQGVLGTVGLSIDTMPMERRTVVNGQSVPVIEGFRKIYSVDLVAEPAAGGGFNRLIAAVNEKSGKEITMPDIVQENTQATPAANTATVPVAAPAQDKLVDQVRRLECQLMLSEKLTAAKLPEHLAKVVKAAFEGRSFEAAELDAVIQRAKESQAAVDPSGQPAPVSGRVEVTHDARDKAEAEFMRIVAGNRTFREIEAAAAKDQAVAERVPEAYTQWVKAGKPNYGSTYLREWTRNLLGGDPLVDHRASEALSTSDLSSIVKNTVNLLAALDYGKRNRWWDGIVRVEEVDTIDAATLVRTFGLTTLSVVSEGNPYTEMSWSDEEETAAFVKKGNYVGVTLETLMGDKVSKIRRIPELLADTWYNTLSALNAAVFTTNTLTGPQLADTGALFNATAVTSAGGHANLLTTALSYAAFVAARLAMRKQTNMPLGVGTKLLIEPKYLLVPADLEATANEILMSELVANQSAATSAMQLQTINQFRNKFEVRVVPEWTDAADWALVGDPVQFPAIYNIFLRGKTVPEIFTANSETEGAMFTNDVLRYKVRMMTWRYSSTYDCAPVADFRPLHKSNV